jgi:putative FmdB family regulatory protein
MPVYTYRCQSCGVQFEQQQKYSDAPLTRCPECNKRTLQKVYQPVGIIFKGSGFYSTDHKSPSGAPRVGEHGRSEEKKGEGEAKVAEEKKAESGSKPSSEKKEE